MDFFSEKELVTQTGHATNEWPLVIVKELVDNSPDACEEADIVPIIDVAADAGGITVKDNGPGLPEPTLKAAMDFTVRASNREAYVAPDRGAQGNALKTILPMSRVLDAEHGRFIVRAHDKKYVITCSADPISQRAVIHDDVKNRRTVGPLGRRYDSNGRPGRMIMVMIFGASLTRLTSETHSSLGRVAGSSKALPFSIHMPQSTSIGSANRRRGRQRSAAVAQNPPFRCRGPPANT
jgi:hypothetical protein